MLYRATEPLYEAMRNQGEQLIFNLAICCCGKSVQVMHSAPA